jgi:hypothetical protein
MDTQLTPSVWVDDTHAIFHRGIVISLIADGLRIPGESAELLSPPLVQLDSRSLRRAPSQRKDGS